MRLDKEANYFLITMSFLIGIILTIIPLPHWVIWARPEWIFAILVFWVITLPLQCGVGIAWTVGVIADLITGTPLGEQTFTFVLLTYIILKLHAVIAPASPWQQAVMILIFTALNALLQGFILGFVGHSTHIGLTLWSAVTTAVVWPWLYMILDRLQPRKFIH